MLTNVGNRPEVWLSLQNRTRYVTVRGLLFLYELARAAFVAGFNTTILTLYQVEPSNISLLAKMFLAQTVPPMGTGRSQSDQGSATSEGQAVHITVQWFLETSRTEQFGLTKSVTCETRAVSSFDHTCGFFLKSILILADITLG